MIFYNKHIEEINLENEILHFETRPLNDITTAKKCVVNEWVSFNRHEVMINYTKNNKLQDNIFKFYFFI